MARKDLLKGLMDAEATPPAPSAPKRATGAIGAVSRSISDLKRRSLVDIDPRMIDDTGGFRDRLDHDPELQALTASIQEYGQQVPVLVRVNPNDPERYQVVYGRRRVAALKSLGAPVKALVRDLDDRALILAQGQENTARKNLTFIEKANFARQMRDAQYDRKVICDALSMDKTLLSRMLQVADAVPVSLIQAIGAAPSFGRDRWLALAAALKGQSPPQTLQGDTSDARFEWVMAQLAKPKSPRPAPPVAVIPGASGKPLAQIERRSAKLTVTVFSKEAEGFDTWLADNIEEIHRTWKTQGGE